MVNCPNCGTSNLDNAPICVNCGRALAPPQTAGAGSYTPPPPPVSSPPPGASFSTAGPAGGIPPSNTSVVVYLVLSILQLLCCCNPVAIVPLIFAILSITRRNAGDYAGAALNAGRTTLWFWVSIAALIVWYIVFFMFMGGAAILEEMRRNMGQ